MRPWSAACASSRFAFSRSWFDHYYPTVNSQEPLFKLLGTPAEHKRRVVYDAAHNISRTEMIKEVVSFLEKYWGKPTPR